MHVHVIMWVYALAGVVRLLELVVVDVGLGEGLLDAGPVLGGDGRLARVHHRAAVAVPRVVAAAVVDGDELLRLVVQNVPVVLFD